MKHHLHPSHLAALALAGILCTFPTSVQAQTYKVIHYFTGGSDGAGPNAGLIFDSSGNLYGTAAGGANGGCSDNIGCGVVFQLSPNPNGWSETVLYAFAGGSDGGNPETGLIFDAKGNLYSTTEFEGSSGCTDNGCGVAFELSPGSSGWTETVLFDFSGATGWDPVAGFVFGKDESLYSTLPNGGTGNRGLVYELSNGGDGWNENTLYRFGGGNEGSVPIAAPIMDKQGNLYGTTCCGPAGTVWELLRETWKELTLYSFTSGGGGGPTAGLVFDNRGNLYGTTTSGGKYQKGVVFKLTPEARGKWKETILHSFKGGSDGNAPFGAVAFDKAGNLYGTTEEGGDPSCDPPYGCGAVFKLAPEAKCRWKETVLHRFNGSDGYGPSTEQLVLDETGNIYGTTSGGGNSGCGNFGCGVVFEITP
jgi:uncharacterized repeat protein (TIGR03803 family)